MSHMVPAMRTHPVCSQRERSFQEGQSHDNLATVEGAGPDPAQGRARAAGRAPSLPARPAGDFGGCDGGSRAHPHANMEGRVAFLAKQILPKSLGEEREHLSRPTSVIRDLPLGNSSPTELYLLFK